MARLPQPGGDSGNWGDILNDYLSQTLKNDGTLKDNSVTNSAIAPNAVTAAELATDAVTAVNIANGSISENLLDTAVQTKLNAGGTTDWSAIANKPAVIAAGATQADARAAISLDNVDNTSDATKNSASATLANKTMSGANNTFSNIPATAIAGTTRTGVFPFEMPNSIGTFTASQPLSNRRLFRIAQTPKRFRVHVRNRNQLADADASGDMTDVSVYMGIPATDANGDPNGNFTATPTQIQSATTVTAGTELISPWISPGTFTINPYQMYMLSIGFVAPTTGQLAFGGGLVWQTYLASDAGVVAPAGISRINNASFLQIYIEYEYDDNAAPSILVVGNSLSNGSNGGGIDNYGELSSWPQIWALNNKGVAASLVMGGGWAAHFMAGNGRWDVYSAVNTPLDYDAVVYMALNSSDLAGGSLAYAKSNMLGAIARGKALYPNARHIITNVPPRVAFTGAVGSAGTLEDDRAQLNTWMHMLPSSTEQCLDIDAVLTDWSNPGRIRSVYDSDGTHPNPRGHVAIAASIPNMRG
ncbi:MAG: hypothetical protein WC426_14325 [Sulfuriferula sp.]